MPTDQRIAPAFCVFNLTALVYAALVLGVFGPFKQYRGKGGMKMISSGRQLVCFFVFVTALAATGCEQKQAEPVNEEPKPEAAVKAEGAGVEAKANDGVQKAPAATENAAAVVYSIEAPDLSVKVGEKGAVKIDIKPIDGYKINEQYPWKVEMTSPENFGVENAKLGKDKWQLSKALASISVPIEAKTAGEGEVKAKVKFSICNEDKCELLKKDIVVKVAAK